MLLFFFNKYMLNVGKKQGKVLWKWPYSMLSVIFNTVDYFTVRVAVKRRHSRCHTCVKMKKGNPHPGSPAYYLIRPLWQPSSLVRSSPTECHGGGMMMYLSDASVFTLLTLLFFPFLFSPICWGHVCRQSRTFRLLTVCEPGRAVGSVSSCRSCSWCCK